MGKTVINNGSSANDGTGDTLRAAATKINDNFTEIYNLLGGEFSADTNGNSQALSTKITLSDSATGLIRFEGTTANAHETTLQVVEPTGDNQIVLPNASSLRLSSLRVSSTLCPILVYYTRVYFNWTDRRLDCIKLNYIFS